MHSVLSAPQSAQIASIRVDPCRRTRPALCSENSSHDGWVFCEPTIAKQHREGRRDDGPCWWAGDVAHLKEEEEEEAWGEGLPASAADVVCETWDCTAPQSQSNRIDEGCGPPSKKHSEIITIKIKAFQHSCTGSGIHAGVQSMWGKRPKGSRSPYSPY